MKILSPISLALLSITAINSPLHCFSLNTMLKQTKSKLVSLLGSNSKTEIFQKDIPRTTQKTLVIENNLGTIKIKTDWTQNTISLKAVKKASAENLAKIKIDIDDQKRDTIHVRTVYLDDTAQGAVDYTLMVPKQMAIRLKTNKGTIKVKRFDGQVWANTDNGTIEIANVTNKVYATITEKGSISIDQSCGTIEAATNNGNITINNAKQSVVATTAKGDIIMQANEVPSTSSIRLDAAGTIQVSLPQETNAHLKASAQNGKVISDHYVTLASRTTKINTQAWSQLQKNVEGTLGTGEAEISLSSAHGSVKILATEVA
jgi:hypothetical protein